MSLKDVVYSWLSSGGAYYLIAFLWLLSAIFFGMKARSLGQAKQSNNDGCYLLISTTVFVMIGGSIGLLIFQRFFPWYILSSLTGAVIAPALTVRVFKHGRRKY